MVLRMDDTLRTLSGEEILDSDGTPVKYKVVFVNLLGSMQTKNSNEAKLVWKLSQKINSANGEIKIDRDEEKIIRAALDQNGNRYTALVIGQIASNI